MACCAEDRKRDLLTQLFFLDSQSATSKQMAGDVVGRSGSLIMQRGWRGEVLHPIICELWDEYGTPVRGLEFSSFKKLFREYWKRLRYRAKELCESDFERMLTSYGVRGSTKTAAMKIFELHWPHCQKQLSGLFDRRSSKRILGETWVMLSKNEKSVEKKQFVGSFLNTMETQWRRQDHLKHIVSQFIGQRKGSLAPPLGKIDDRSRLKQPPRAGQGSGAGSRPGDYRSFAVRGEDDSGDGVSRVSSAHSEEDAGEDEGVGPSIPASTAQLTTSGDVKSSGEQCGELDIKSADGTPRASVLCLNPLTPLACQESRPSCRADIRKSAPEGVAACPGRPQAGLSSSSGTEVSKK